MKTDIGIWEIDRSSRAGTKLRLTERVDTEEMLEAVLVANPDMLMSGLTLVGRQVPVETGFVDLLGIDEDGRLVHRFRSSMTYTHAALSSEGVPDPDVRAMRRVRSCRVNFHWKGEAICW